MKMSAREGVYYAAWMAGIGITVPICRAAGVHHLISLLIGFGVGWGLGVMAEKMYDSWRQSRSDEDTPFGGHRDDFRK